MLIIAIIESPLAYILKKTHIKYVINQLYFLIINGVLKTNLIKNKLHLPRPLILTIGIIMSSIGTNKY